MSVVCFQKKIEGKKNLTPSNEERGSTSPSSPLIKTQKSSVHQKSDPPAPQKRLFLGRAQAPFDFPARFPFSTEGVRISLCPQRVGTRMGSPQ